MPVTASLGKILIVDSDESIADLLRINLCSEGYAVELARHASEVKPAAMGDTVLVIADSMCENYSGMDLVYDLRDNPATAHVGIIIYSASSCERTAIDVLDAGADDYVIKPFSLREIIARIKSVLRRRTASTQHGTGHEITLDSLCVDLRTKTVRVDGKPVALTVTEYAILTLLLRRINTYVNRIEIHRSIWAGTESCANERIVDTNISRLRKKLGAMGLHITNRSGLGYMIS